jgi:hypothetical protein
VKTTNHLFPTLAALFVLSWTMACQSSTETKSVAVNQPATTTTTNSTQSTIAPTATAQPPADNPPSVLWRRRPTHTRPLMPPGKGKI